MKLTSATKYVRKDSAKNVKGARKIRINENKKMGVCEYFMHLIFKIFSIMDVLYGGRKD